MKMAGNLTPPLQVGLENMFDTQLWSGRKKSDLYQSPSRDQRINDLINISPLSRVASTIRRTLPVAIGKPIEEATGLKFYDERKNAADKMVAMLIGGLKITDVDIDKAMSIEGRSMIEDALAPINEVRSFSRIYVKPEDLATMTPEELRLYSLNLYLLARSRRVLAAKKKAGR
jgi:hypothetical protein